MKQLLAFLLLIFSLQLFAEPSCDARWSQQFPDRTRLDPYWTPFWGHCDRDLKDMLGAAIATNTPLEYRDAKKYMFEFVYNDNGLICDLYSSNCVQSRTVPSDKVMNCEHTWPQSHGAVGVAKADLFHLFPATSFLNNMRANFPFCDVSRVIVNGGESRLGENLTHEKCFEPPLKSKGKVARAIFYFSTRYKFPVSQSEEYYLKIWAQSVPVNSEDLERAARITKMQGNFNPFINLPQLVNLISDF